MQLVLVLTLAGHDGAASPIGVAIVFATAVAIVGLLGRRRMPAGLGQGASVAAVSGGVLLLFGVGSRGDFVQPALGHTLTALAVFWYALSKVAAWRQRFATGHGAGSDDGDDSARERWQILTYAALVCGLAAAVGWLTAPGGVTRAGWPAAIDSVVLLFLCVAVWLLRSGPSGAYPAVVLLGCLFVRAFPSDRLGAHAAACGVALNVAGVLSLSVVIGAVLLSWWRRRRRWLQGPQRLAEPTPPSNILCAVLVGVGLLVGVCGVLLRDAPLTPTAVLAAAVTCLTIGHLRNWSASGEIGLILLAGSIVTASLAWLRLGWSGALLGLGLAGIYLLWLARFWDQQLKDGVPWTTAGGLIPVARRLAYTAAAGTFALAMGGYSTAGFQTQPVWTAALTVVLLLGYMSLLVRDGYEHRHSGGVFGACLVALAAAGPAGRLVLELGDSAVWPMVLIAGAALLLALRTAMTPRVPQADVVYRACIGGALPVTLLFALTLRGFDGESIAASVLTLVAVVVGFKAFRASAETIQGDQAGHV